MMMMMMMMMMRFCGQDDDAFTKPLSKAEML
jgi:hypothetical protein